MPLDLDYGYTLAGETAPAFVFGNIEYTNLPVVSFTYAPALPEACAQYRMDFRRATTGKEEIQATAKFLADHLRTWNVTIKGQPAKIDAASVADVPEVIQEQMARIVSKWAPKAADAKGNS